LKLFGEPEEELGRIVLVAPLGIDVPNRAYILRIIYYSGLSQVIGNETTIAPDNGIRLNARHIIVNRLQNDGIHLFCRDGALNESVYIAVVTNVKQPLHMFFFSVLFLTQM
jgi:hypothetical protein